MNINLEELLNETAESDKPLNETIENLSKAIIAMYGSFNPEAIPKDYKYRQIAQKRPKEYEVDVSQMKRLLSAYKAGKRFEDVYNKALRVVAGNPDIFDNVEKYMEKVYGVETKKKEEPGKPAPEKKEEPETDGEPEVVKSKVSVSANRRAAEGRFITDLKKDLSTDFNIEALTNNIRLTSINYGKKLKEIEDKISVPDKQNEEIAEALFEDFANKLKEKLKDTVIFKKTDVRIKKIDDDFWREFEIKENSSKSLIDLKYTQQLRISHEFSFSGLNPKNIDRIIEIYNMAVNKLFASPILQMITDKMNAGKEDLLTRVGGKIVVINKNEYKIKAFLHDSETRAGDGKSKIKYILFKVIIPPEAKRTPIRDYFND